MTGTFQEDRLPVKVNRILKRYVECEQKRQHFSALELERHLTDDLLIRNTTDAHQG